MVLDFCKIALEGSPTREYEEDAEILSKAIKIIERDGSQKHIRFLLNLWKSAELKGITEGIKIGRKEIEFTLEAQRKNYINNEKETNAKWKQAVQKLKERYGKQSGLYPGDIDEIFKQLTK